MDCITPMQKPLIVHSLHPSNTTETATLHRAAVVLFRNDLRIHDNECLTKANKESISVLPFYCFDPRDYIKSSSNSIKTGSARAKFLFESVSDLRKNLQACGSDLMVRIGKPESILLELVKAVGADAVYMHREVSREEVKMEEKIEEVMKGEGVDVKYFWGSTLYHMEDLPFELEQMPTNYGEFKEMVKSLEVRKTIKALDVIKDLPKRGDIELGNIPSLVDLGLDPNVTSKDQSGNVSLVGGETEALQKLRNFAAECKAKPISGFKDALTDNTYGTTLSGQSITPFASKLSPWLATGCLSPRSVFDELKKSTSSMSSASSTTRNDGGQTSSTETDWFMYELLWRDFFRFITRKYNSHK